MENNSNTFESVWATLQEFGAKLEQSHVEAELRRVEADQSSAEIKKQFKELGEYIKQVSQQLGGMGNSNGDFAEEFFYNALLRGKRNILGEEFDDVMKKSNITFNKGYEDEYDILLVNRRAVCIIEVKYKADSKDLPQKVLRKAFTFRVNFPNYHDKTVYLAIAAMSSNPLTEKACKEQGIAIMKQVGDTVTIYDKHLKAF